MLTDADLLNNCSKFPTKNGASKHVFLNTWFLAWTTQIRDYFMGISYTQIYVVWISKYKSMIVWHRDNMTKEVPSKVRYWVLFIYKGVGRKYRRFSKATYLDYLSVLLYSNLYHPRIGFKSNKGKFPLNAMTKRTFVNLPEQTLQ